MSDIGTYEAVILGLVEGLTEFIPVSSTGHLVLASSFLGIEGEKAKLFEICIQLGAILAVGMLYFKRLYGLLTPSDSPGFTGHKGLLALFLGCLPAALAGMLFASAIKAHLFYPLPVGIALITGSFLILFFEKFKPGIKYSNLDQLSAKTCFYIGIFQALSLWPGMSRSASSIIGGMALGLERKVAAELSFLMAVPLIFAATAYDLYKNWHLLMYEDLKIFLIGSGVAFVSAAFAVKGFIALLSRFSLVPFAYYRLVVGIIVVIYFA